MAAPELFGTLLDADAASAWREQQRAQGRRVVFTNGVFDVLHAGHIEYLAWARSQGDALIVGLNSDASVREIKGERRPPEALLERIRPDVHVKSAQYREEELPERAVVLAHGGEVRLAPHLAGRSTTDIIGEIVARYG